MCYTTQPPGWFTWISSAPGRRSAPAAGGAKRPGQLAVDLTPDLYGTLELHAYKIFVRRHDRARHPPGGGRPCRWADRPDRPRAGHLQTRRHGQPATAGERAGWRRASQSALGLAIVDERVFALAEQDPGFAGCTSCWNRRSCTPNMICTVSACRTWSTALPGERPGCCESAVDGAAQASLADAVPNRRSLQPERQLAPGCHASAPTRCSTSTSAGLTMGFVRPVAPGNAWACSG